jgi:hypothetical protein
MAMLAHLSEPLRLSLFEPGAIVRPGDGNH